MSTGCLELCKALKSQGVDFIFGVVGVPIIEVAFAAQAVGIKYYGFRNEQAASYAAGAVGYLTGRPGVCLCVSGPGVIHGVAGLANAWANCWPMILLGGATDADQDAKEGFQEAPQIESCRPYIKMAARIDSIERIPLLVEKAVKTSIAGRPGGVYLEIPGQLVNELVKQEPIPRPFCPPPPTSCADAASVALAMTTLRGAQRPLVILGKGAAYAKAEGPARALIEGAQLPYLPTPMGKGLLPDDHPLCVAPARAKALANADVILLVGARLNWMLHFGLPPRFRADVKILQIDIAAEQFDTNVRSVARLQGDACAILQQLVDAHQAQPWKHPSGSEWWKELNLSMTKNLKQVAQMMADDSVPMGYYRVFKDVRDCLPRDCIVVGEGANTMDIGRTVIGNFFPRHRLDAGTFGTMGVGMGFAIAAAVVHPDKKVVAVLGDSAFGFSGMELETVCRFKLPITIIVINNNGIFTGISEMPSDPTTAPPLALTPNAHYEKIIEAFGGKGFFITKPHELLPTLRAALSCPLPTLVNIMINPEGQRKPQEFAWLTRADNSKL